MSTLRLRSCRARSLFSGPCALHKLEDISLGKRHSLNDRNNGLSILDIGLVALEPVGPRALESIQAERAAAAKHVDLVHDLLDGSAELPAVIGGIVIVRRDKDVVAVVLGGFEQLFDVLDGLVLLDAVAAELPRDAFLAKEVILRIDYHQCSIVLSDIHGFSPFIDQVAVRDTTVAECMC